MEPNETPPANTPSQTPPSAAPAAAAVPPAAAPGPEPKKEPIYRGASGEIFSMEELVAHTQKLEAKTIEQTLSQPPTVPAAPAAPVEKTPYQLVEDLLFVDPAKAVETLATHLRQEIRQDNALQTVKENFWKGFYEENQDLKGLERIVGFAERDHADKVKKMSLPEAKKFLAEEARKILAVARHDAGTTERPLPSGGGAHIAPSGADRGRPQAGEKTLSFVEQVAGMRKHRV